MALDPSRFSAMAVSDTCSVWNILSSRKLFNAAVTARLHFCITPMVLYECLYKPRASVTTVKQEMIKRLENARSAGSFPSQECDLDDLAALSSIAPKGLGSGEMSCMAMAYRIRTLAFMTDEKKARRYAETQLGLTVETTVKLYAWLHYHGHLSDGDHAEVIREHEIYESRPLTTFFNDAYEEALRGRLMARGYDTPRSL